MLKLINDAHSRPYLGSRIDGVYGRFTQAAIDKFQADYGIDNVPIRPGVITPGGSTLQTMSTLLPANRSDLRVLTGQKVVYVAGSKNVAQTLVSQIKNDQQFRASFRKNIATLVEKMYEQHGVVLHLTPSGGRRDFAAQAAVNPKSTKAGPGESNHQYGNAVDIGFNGLTWIRRSGVTVTDNHWLSKLNKTNHSAAKAFWDARDAIALAAPLNLHNLRPMELIHLQDFDQSTVSMGRSLATHLSAMGRWRWRAAKYVRAKSDWHYSCDLGGINNTFVVVGTANEIWDGKATVTANEIRRAGWVRPTSNTALVSGTRAQPAQLNPIGVSARTAASGPITSADIETVRAALKADFTAADTAWRRWVAVP